MSNEKSLQDWIKGEMTISEEEVLNNHKERIARILGVTQDGGVFFRIDKSGLDAEGQIGAYLIGKLFAHVGDFAEEETVSNQELAQALRMPAGTIRGTLTRMRDRGTAESTQRGLHRVPINTLPKLLRQIELQMNDDASRT